MIESSRNPDERLRIWFLNDLGTAAIGQNRWDDARRYLEEALEVRERIYPDELHPERLSGLNNLAFVLMRQGNTVRARQLVEPAYRKGLLVYGEEHPANVGSLTTISLKSSYWKDT